MGYTDILDDVSVTSKFCEQIGERLEERAASLLSIWLLREPPMCAF